MAVTAARPALRAAARVRLPAGWGLPFALAAVIGSLTLVPYLFAWATEPRGHVFMGFFFLNDDANTYLSKMRQGWEGNWLWHNRYTTESGPGAYFFIWWIALGRLAAVLHVPLIGMFHLMRFAGAFVLLGWGWSFIKQFLPEGPARRWALWFLAVGLGMGYVIQALGAPSILGIQSDTLDWRMPELTAFYSILALPHFVWAAAFQAIAIVLTLRAAERGSLRLGALAGLAWLGESSIHAQMPLLLAPAVAIALVVRPVSGRGYVAAALAFAVAAPYVGYSYYESQHSPEVLRWSAQWRNNLPPEGVSLALALLPQLLLAALAVPGAIRRRSREDVFLLAWLLLLAAILWLPNPAGNLRRRFFDGLYLPLVVLAARGMWEVLLPRLRSLRARRLVPFSYVAFAAMGSFVLLLAPLAISHSPQYSITTSERHGLDWLAAQPAGAVLSTDRLGLYVPAYTPDTVYVGQYSETYNWRAKGRQALDLLTGHGDAGAFAREHGLRYVLWSDSTGAGEPAGLGEPDYSEPGLKVWRLG